MTLGERRYIVRRNLAEAEKDAADREAIVANLRRALKTGDKVLVGNAGYRRFLKAPEVGFVVDEERVAGDARFDGIFVLRTNATLDPLQAMLRYRELQGVEQLFRSAKSLLATRPIFHKCDATIRGHVFCSFLALVLQKELAGRCAARGFQPEWDEVRRDLDRLQEVEVEQAASASSCAPRPPAAPASCSRPSAWPCPPTSATPLPSPPPPSPSPPNRCAKTARARHKRLKCAL